jgi:hypothetical protein
LPSAVLKAWRDQLIRNLAAEGRIEKSANYTRFIDELAKQNAAPPSKSEILAAVQEQLDRLQNKSRSRLQARLQNEIAATVADASNPYFPAEEASLQEKYMSLAEKMIASGLLDLDLKRNNYVYDYDNGKILAFDYDFIHELPSDPRDVDSFLRNRTQDPDGRIYFSPAEQLFVRLFAIDDNPALQQRLVPSLEPEEYRRLKDIFSQTLESGEDAELNLPGNQALQKKAVDALVTRVLQLRFPESVKFRSEVRVLNADVRLQIMERLKTPGAEAAVKALLDGRADEILEQHDKRFKSKTQFITQEINLSWNALRDWVENENYGSRLKKHLRDFLREDLVTNAEVDVLAAGILEAVFFGETADLENSYLAAGALDHAKIQKDQAALDQALGELVRHFKGMPVPLLINEPGADAKQVHAALKPFADAGIFNVSVLFNKAESFKKVPYSAHPVGYDLPDRIPAAVHRLKVGLPEPVLLSVLTQNLNLPGGEANVFKILARIEEIQDEDLKRLAYTAVLYALLRFTVQSTDDQRKMLARPGLLGRFINEDAVLAGILSMKDGNVFLDSARLVASYAAAQALAKAA